MAKNLCDFSSDQSKLPPAPESGGAVSDRAVLYREISVVFSGFGVFYRVL